MQIVATPNSPYGSALDRSFKTVTAAMRFIVRSYFENNGVARSVVVYNSTAPTVKIGFVTKSEMLLESGSVDGWEIGTTKPLDEALQLLKNYHRED